MHQKELENFCDSNSFFMYTEERKNAIKIARDKRFVIYYVSLPTYFVYRIM